MNLKKYIKLKEEAREALKEEEEALYKALLPRVEQNAAQRTAMKRRVSLWKILTLVATIAVAIAITLTCVFTQHTYNGVYYNDDKIKTEESTFKDMQRDIKFVDLTYIEYNIDAVLMSYDYESNDRLFYSISARVDLSTIKLIIVVNERYNYEFIIKGDTEIQQLENYTVTYSSESSRGDSKINYRGWIKVETEIVYFDYVQTPALGNEAFFETIQQIIQVKQ